MTSTSRSSDKGAAYLGLIIGALTLAVMMVGIVAWTNSRYAGHEGAERAEPAASAETPK